MKDINVVGQKKRPERVIKWPTHSFVCFFMHMTIDKKCEIFFQTSDSQMKKSGK